MSVLNIFTSKPQKKESCKVHGHQWHDGKSGNRMLIGMVEVSLGLIMWHVWTYGPSGHPATSGEAVKPFPLLRGN